MHRLRHTRRLGLFRLLAFDEDSEGAGGVLNRSNTAEVVSAQAVAADAVDTEDVAPRIRLAGLLLQNPDLQEGKIVELLGEYGLAIGVGKSLFAPGLHLQLFLVIARDQQQVRVDQWLAIEPIEDPDSNRLVMYDRKGFIGTGRGCGQQQQGCSQQ